MNKSIVFLLTVFLAASLSAQSPGRFGSSCPAEGRGERERVSVSGTLVLSGGFIALKSGDDLYYTIGLDRLVGFVDGLKENAEVRLEGYDRVLGGPGAPGAARDSAETRHFFRVTKLEIGGRDYELGGLAAGPGPRGHRFSKSRPGVWYGSMNGRGCGPGFGRPGFGRSGHGRNRR